MSASQPVLKLTKTTPDPNILEQLILLGYEKDVAQRALIATMNQNINIAIDWIEENSRLQNSFTGNISNTTDNTSQQQQQMEVEGTPSSPIVSNSPTSPTTAEPLPTPPQSQPLSQLQPPPTSSTTTTTTTTTTTFSPPSSLASLVNLPPPNIKVESRIPKNMEEEKRQWELEQAKKEYERLQRDKKAKKNQESLLKAQIESDRRSRAEQLGVTPKTKTKEEQELEWRQKETERERIRIQQRNAAERREKERVKKLLEEDKMKREMSNTTTATLSTTSTDSTTTATSTTTQTTTVTQPQGGNKDGPCILQIRLPHGNPLRQKFNSSDFLSDVHAYVASHLTPGTAFTFIIPMPKTEFTHEHMNKTLAELGLRGATLTVLTSLKRGIVKQSPASDQSLTGDVDQMSYEELVDLGNRIGPHKPKKAAETIAEKISKIPTKTYTAPITGEGEDPPLCLICQCPFEEGEEIKELLCNHSFHVLCIDPWLRDHNSCPLCNAKIYE